MTEPSKEALGMATALLVAHQDKYGAFGGCLSLRYQVAAVLQTLMDERDCLRAAIEAGSRLTYWKQRAEAAEKATFDAALMRDEYASQRDKALARAEAAEGWLQQVRAWARTQMAIADDFPDLGDDA